MRGSNVVRRAAALASLAMWSLAPGAFASHSVPSPTYVYQSALNNGAPTAATTVRPAGTASTWTTARLDRLDLADDQWRLNSQFDPTLNRTVAPSNCFESATCHGVWIDGSDPFGDLTDESILAVNYGLWVLRTDPGDGEQYYDIDDWDIYFNTGGAGHPVFTYTAAGSSDASIFDFQGVVTHELGHSISLIDLYAGCHYGTNMETMCGQISGIESTRLRSIQTDDINGANLVY